MTDTNVETTNPETTQVQTDWEAKARELEAKAAQLEAEAAKERGKRKTLENEYFTLKKEAKHSDSSPKSGKAEREDANNEVVKFLKEKVTVLESRQAVLDEKAKTVAIKEAASSKLGSMGLNPAALHAALKLLDRNLVQYDADTDSVDDTALGAAVSKLKSENPFLFEKAVNTPKIRQPGEGSAKGDANQISKEDWRNLSGPAKREAIKSGKRVEA